MTIDTKKDEADNRLVNKLAVEVGIPLTASKTQSKYPIATLQVGESFLIPGSITNVESRASSLAFYWSRKLQRRYVTRRVADGIRIWRLADQRKET